MTDEPVINIAPTPWDELDARGQRRITMLISTLSEIEAGFQHSEQVTRSAPKVARPHDHPLMRFMLNSLTNYACGAFMGSSAGALDVLRSVNLGLWADSLDALLEKPVGSHTLRTFMEDHRNTTVAHPTFDHRQMQRRVFDPASLEDDAIREQFRTAITEFLNAARLTLALIRKVYPIAAASEDLRWKDWQYPPIPE